jgi:hypothetical protein
MTVGFTLPRRKHRRVRHCRCGQARKHDSQRDTSAAAR